MAIMVAEEGMEEQADLVPEAALDLRALNLELVAEIDLTKRLGGMEASNHSFP